MKVVVFDLLPYDANLDHLKGGSKELPYPLSRRHFDARTAVRTYAEHLEAWAEIDRLGYDGIAFNEHHCSPYGLMNSPNLMAAAAAQRTSRVGLHVYANLLPLHEPLRLAEELSMLDCISGGRLRAGIARGIPREYQVYNVPPKESRARFEEAYDILLRAWTEEVFSYRGQFWSYSDVALWPRPVQAPHPPIWMPITSSKESIEFAGRNNIAITPGTPHRGLREDVIGYYARCLAENGHQLTPDHIELEADVYLADSKEQAIAEKAPYYLYFNRTLFSHGNATETAIQRGGGYVSTASADYIRPENLAAASGARENYRDLTMDKLVERAQHMAWGTADEVIERLTEEADHAGANTMMIQFNRGALPQELFLNQIRRFAEQVLPALQAHRVDVSAATRRS